MIKFILSRFISKDKALELLGENEEKITKLSKKNKHLSTAVKAGFKIWSLWKVIVICWYGLLFFLVLGGLYLVYVIVSKFI